MIFPDNWLVLRIGWDTLLGRTPKVPSTVREPDRILGYVQTALVEGRGKVRREDETAVIILIAAGVVAGVVAVGLLNGYWRPGELSSKIEWLWWTGLFFWLLGILMLVAALHPRTSGLGARALERRRSYVGGFVAEARPEPRRDGSEGRDRVDLLVMEIRRLSALADAKQRYIRRGVLLMLLSTAWCTLAALISPSL